MGASATKISEPYNRRMISREPTLERLDVARRLLLEPFGLDESDLIHTLSAIKAHKVDEADLYFQYTRAEGWSLEEGMSKRGLSASTKALACAQSVVRKLRLRIQTISRSLL